jgi:hypothetical protein
MAALTDGQVISAALDFGAVVHRKSVGVNALRRAIGTARLSLDGTTGEQRYEYEPLHR